MLRRLLVPVLVFFIWVPVASAWSWPVQGPVLQAFLYDEAHPYAAGQHRGIDIGAAAKGEQVVAPATGTISFAGSVPTSGLSLTIATPDGYSVTLTHLGSTLAARGAAVAEGAVVGTIGPSGTPEVDGPYVHLGIRITSDPNGYLDPLTLLPDPQSTSSSSGDGTSSQPAAGGSGSADTGAPSDTSTTATTSSDTSAPPATSTSSTSSASSGASTRGAHAAGGQVHGRPGSADAARPAASAPAARPVPRAATKPRASTARESRAGVVLVPPHRRSSARPANRASRPLVQSRVPGRPAQTDVRQAVPRSPSLLPLILNGAAALIAVTAALLVGLGRRRRRGAAPVVANATILRLPQHRPRPRHARHAA